PLDAAGDDLAIDTELKYGRDLLGTVVGESREYLHLRRPLVIAPGVEGNDGDILGVVAADFHELQFRHPQRQFIAIQNAAIRIDPQLRASAAGTKLIGVKRR